MTGHAWTVNKNTCEAIIDLTILYAVSHQSLLFSQFWEIISDEHGIDPTFIFTFLGHYFPKVYPKWFHEFLQMSFCLINIASVSGQCVHYIFKICQIVESIKVWSINLTFSFLVFGNYFRWAWNWPQFFYITEKLFTQSDFTSFY